MKQDKWLFGCLISVALLLLFSVPVQAGSQDLNLKLKSGDYVQNIDNLYLIIDRSGSMLESFDDQSKFDIEKDLALEFNKTIPDLNLKAGLRTLGNNFIDSDVTKLNQPIDKYDAAALDKVIHGICCPFGDTHLGIAIMMAGTNLSKVPGKSALVIFSDGGESDNYAVKAATSVKSLRGDNLCIYTVQIGDDVVGGKLLDQVARIGQCGFSAKGSKLASDADMTDFMGKIVLAYKPPEPAAPVAPPPPPAPIKEPEVVAPPAPVPPPPVEEIKKAPEAEAGIEQKMVETGRVTLKVEFDTGKSVVKPRYDKEIQNVADFLKKNPDKKIMIGGHTDTMGNKKANLTLSQKRADAVKKVLVSKFGIKSSRIEAKGFGGSKPVTSNATAEGRQQNRRVEAVIE